MVVQCHTSLSPHPPPRRQSPDHDDPRVYSKRKPDARTVALALSHALPWPLLRVQTTIPELLTSDSVSMLEPYM
jgi:hypothetical protein